MVDTWRPPARKQQRWRAANRRASAAASSVWDLAESRTVADVPAAETIRGLALSVGAKYLAVIDDENSLMLHALSNGQATRVHFNPAGRSRFINPGEGTRAIRQAGSRSFQPQGRRPGDGRRNRCGHLARV